MSNRKFPTNRKPPSPHSIATVSDASTTGEQEGSHNNIPSSSSRICRIESFQGLLYCMQLSLIRPYFPKKKKEKRKPLSTPTRGIPFHPSLSIRVLFVPTSESGLYIYISKLIDIHHLHPRCSRQPNKL